MHGGALRTHTEHTHTLTPKDNFWSNDSQKETREIRLFWFWSHAVLLFARTIWLQQKLLERHLFFSCNSLLFLSQLICKIFCLNSEQMSNPSVQCGFCHAARQAQQLSYVRVLFSIYSSAINTYFHQAYQKLQDLGLDHHRWNWQGNVLSSHPQHRNSPWIHTQC